MRIFVRHIGGPCGGTPLRRAETARVGMGYRYTLYRVSAASDLDLGAWIVSEDAFSMKSGKFDEWHQNHLRDIRNEVAEERLRLERLVAADFLEEQGFSDQIVELIRKDQQYSAFHEYPEFAEIEPAELVESELVS